MSNNERSERAVRRGRAGLIAVAVVLAVVSGALVAATTGAVHPEPAGAYPLGDGYWMSGTDGGIFSFGDAQYFGSTGNIQLNQPIVGMAAHPFLEGYWFAATDGGVFNYGSAGYFGSMGGTKLVAPVTGIAAHPSGYGYWLVAADGGIFTFGAAGYFGSMGGQKLNAPIVGIAATPSGKGYWMVATDGGIFAFGDAPYLGSMGGTRLNRPIVGIAASPSGNGYWMVASDGGIFTFGDAPYRGSMGGKPLNRPVVGITPTPSGNGYWMVATDGGIFTFGDAPYLGSMGGRPLNRPIIGMATRPRLAVSADPFSNDGNSSSAWSQTSGDWRLALTNTASDSTPAGARILGVEGLDLGQLGTIKVALDAGTCPAGPTMALYLDTNGDRVADHTASLSCAQLVAGVNAVAAAGKPASSWVAGVDLIHANVGTVAVDDIQIAGLTITDYRPARAA